LGVDSSTDKIPFYPYCYVKDLFNALLFVVFFSIFLFYYPNLLGHPDNYIPANPMVTPAHIVPEWYFLPFYAILRSIPDKLGGVIAMFGAIVVLFLIPFINQSEVRSSTFRPIYRKLFWFLFADFLILGWIGQKVVETPYIEVGQIATVLYFLFFCVVLPGLGLVESAMIKHK
jgi:ubiquinol-cytochrome c reductase cytochrome b subunit